MNFIALIFTILLLVMESNSQVVFDLKQKYSKKENAQSETQKIDSWISIDKGQHLIGSFVGTILISKINNRHFDVNKTNSNNLGMGIMFSIGLSKEILDKQKPENMFSWKDMTANITGILLAIAILGIK